MSDPYIRKRIKDMVDTSEDVHFSKKHYRPQHSGINKKRHYFNNDWIIFEGKTFDIKEIGTNKRKLDVHSESKFDTWKDGNGYN